jgi:hypothetical protein
MSTTTAYFIPAKTFPVGQFEANVKKVLDSLGIIDGYYDEDDEWYASGGIIAFEYASIHDTDKNKLVPESSAEGYGSVCPTCKGDTDDDFYDSINDYYDYEGETGKEKDMTTLPLTCSHCKAATTLGKLSFTQPVIFASQYFQFVDVEDEIATTLLKNMEAGLDTTLTVFFERM